MNISPIPAFNDNYLWLIDDGQDHAVILDPGDASPVIKVLEERHLSLTAILITHHHNDHIGGINSLLEYENVPVYGPDTRKIPQITNPIKHGDLINLFNDSLVLETLEVPGHTQEHIAYFGQIDDLPVLFPGDTLFAAGCGRLLGGTHQQLFHSLSMINQLPETTKIFSSHEYTLANLNFAQAVEPKNDNIQRRIKEEEQKRLENRPTLPTNLKLERLTNPFLRVHQPSVAESINHHWNNNWTSNEELFGALRKWKDSF